MGHIALAAPVTHIWFLRSVPSKIGLLLDLSVQNLEKVIYFASFVITKVDESQKKMVVEELKNEYKSKRKQIENEFSRDVERLAEKEKKDQEALEATSAWKEAVKIRDRKLSELEEDFVAVDRELKELAPMAIVSENTYHDWSLKFGHIFEAGIGAEAVSELLRRIDIAKTVESLKKELLDAGGAKAERIIRRLRLLKSLAANGIRPDWMILTNIPVIPPDLRPMVPLDGGRFATSDLNDLYRRVINRNNRLKRLVELNAPEVISRNEKRMLQEAVDALIDNSARQSKTVVATTGKKRQLKSLADILKGKQGRFRQNLLGKRTDYSGRSVIVVGPTLRLHQCGIPKKMALELFKPFVISRLIQAAIVHNIRSANRYIEADHPEVWDILEDITKNAHVLLNRAPTLHRLGIQAFQPILIEGKAIRIHPMVTTAFNADFDGDQMAVHVPLTEEAKREARELMLSSKNLLKPATGNPVASTNKDMTWGCYYLTQIFERPDGQIKVFSSAKEAIAAYNLKKIGLQEKIKVRLPKASEGLFETTVGRILFNRALPAGLAFQNELMDQKKLNELIRYSLELFGQEKTAEFLDSLKQTGFNYVTQSGHSWGMNDLPPVPQKAEIVADGERRVSDIESQYAEGLLTDAERHAKIIEVWTEVKDRIQKHSKEVLDKSGSVFTMMDSGARGSPGQLTQMIGMKGLVSSPSGDIIELPVKAGFKEGFDVLEYFISTHGTRKGLSDTALRTANAGYLTRRLVDVAQDVVVRDGDCGDEDGEVITAAESEEMGETLAHRIVGRYAIEDIKHSRKTLVKAGELVTEEKAREIAKLPIESAHVRTVLKCRLTKGVCATCYGFDLSFNQPVQSGVAVGIIAAQSIGEPGTQLTMRTFHTGGVAGADITQGLPRVEELFESRPPKRKAFVTEVGGKVTVEEISRRSLEGEGGKKILDLMPGMKVVRVESAGVSEERYFKEEGSTLKVKDKASVVEGGVLFEKKDGTAVVSKTAGIARVKGSEITVVGEGKEVREYIIPPGYTVKVKDGMMLMPGDPLTDGDLDLQQLYQLKGREAVQNYIRKGIQSIYTSQGQKLNDKHIEIIIRQMFSRVYVEDAGDTELLPGETIELAEFAAENEKAKKAKKELARGKELLLGISKISLSTQSFLSAASFQETAKVLINAAVTGKVDRLEGLKENVIIGRLIPAGTGFGLREKLAAAAAAGAEK
jgi:DNA-directed RNA polymerase subunit beta'